MHYLIMQLNDMCDLTEEGVPVPPVIHDSGVLTSGRQTASQTKVGTSAICGSSQRRDFVQSSDLFSQSDVHD